MSNEVKLAYNSKGTQRLINLNVPFFLINLVIYY